MCVFMSVSVHFSNVGGAPWKQKYLRLMMGPWALARRIFPQARGSDSATRQRGAASSQPTRVGHWAPDDNYKYFLLTINEVQGFISLSNHSTYGSHFTEEETELRELRPKVLVLYCLLSDIAEPSLASGNWNFLEPSIGVSLFSSTVLCLHLSPT